MSSVELQIAEQERSLVPSATSLVSAHSARMTVAHFAGAAFLAHSASLASETFRGSVRSIVAEQQVLHRFRPFVCVLQAIRRGTKSRCRPRMMRLPVDRPLRPVGLA